MPAGSSDDFSLDSSRFNDLWPSLSAQLRWERQHLRDDDILAAGFLADVLEAWTASLADGTQYVSLLFDATGVLSFSQRV